MKLSVAIAGKDALPSAFVVWRGFEESMKKASEYGYHGVELALKTTDDIDPSVLSKLLGRFHLDVSCISTGQVFAAMGLYFTHPDKEIRNQAIKVFSGLIALAADFGKLVNIGRVRGFVDKGQTREEAQNLFFETAEQICGIAVKKDVTLVLEPINRYESNFINSLDEASELLNKSDLPCIGLMPDVFHMNIEDDRIGNSLLRNASRVRYVHFADSNRLAPGRGHIDFDDVFDALMKSRYNDWASIEILPAPDPDTAAKQAAEYMLPRLKCYNKMLTR